MDEAYLTGEPYEISKTPRFNGDFRCTGMVAAPFGYLPPIWGAAGRELIDLLAVLNAVRVAMPTNDLWDF